MRPSIHACMSWADINLMSPQVPSNLITRVEQTIRILVSFFLTSFWLWNLRRKCVGTSFFLLNPTKTMFCFQVSTRTRMAEVGGFVAEVLLRIIAKRRGKTRILNMRWMISLGGGFKHFFITSTPTRGKWSKLTNIFQMGWNHQLDSGLDIYIFFGGVTGVQEYYQSHPDPIIQGWTSFWALTGNGISLIWAWFGPPENKETATVMMWSHIFTEFRIVCTFTNYMLQ